MVGTIFTNYMANILTTVSNRITIKVKNKFLDKKFEIGGLYKNIKRNLNFIIPEEDYKNTEILIYEGENEIGKIKNIDLIEMKPELLEQYYREKLINLIYENTLKTPNFEEVEKKIKKLFEDISKENNKTVLMQNILIDLINDDPNHGQVEKSFKKEYYNKWGLNYLLSFLRFHITEQCGNFKDQS